MFKTVILPSLTILADAAHAYTLNPYESGQEVVSFYMVKTHLQTHFYAVPTKGWDSFLKAYQAAYIVPSGEHHEGQNQRKSNAEADFLHFFA